MTVYLDKVRGKWRYDFWRKKVRYVADCLSPDGSPVQTEADAQDCEDLRRASIIQDERQGRIAANAGRGYSLAQAVAARTELATRLKSWHVTKDYLIEILAYFKPETPVAVIDAVRMNEYVTWGLQQKAKIWMAGPRKRAEAVKRNASIVLQKEIDRTRSAKTMNKYLSALRMTLKQANATVDPATANDPVPRKLLAIMPAVPFLKVPKRKPRPIPMVGLAQVWKTAPLHLRHFITATQLTQLRESEILRMEIDALDEEQKGLWLDPANKGNRDDFIPLGPKGMVFFRRLKLRSIDAEQKHFILYDDHKTGELRPILSVSKSFGTQLKKAGLVGHRLHQTKTTALSQLRRLGTDPATLQDMARHKDYATTKDHYLGEETESRRRAISKYEPVMEKAGMLVSLRGKSKAKKRTKGKSHTRAVPHGSPTRAPARKRA